MRPLLKREAEDFICQIDAAALAALARQRKFSAGGAA